MDKLRKLGSSSMMLSPACLGCMTFGEQNTEEESFEILDEFVRLGGNCLDTAELYPVPPSAEKVGETDNILGRWFASRPGAQVAGPTPANGITSMRERTLTGKADPEAPLPRLVPAQIVRSVEASLVRLQTSHLDLIQLHWPDRYTPLWGNLVYRHGLEGKHSQQERPADDADVPFDDVVAAIGKLIAEGKVRAWGLSNETTYGVCEWVAAAKRAGVPPPCSIQNDFSLLDRRFEGELAEACSARHHDVGLIAYGCLCGGTLSGKYNDRPGAAAAAAAEGEDGYAGGATPGGGAATAGRALLSRSKSRHTLFPKFQARYHCPAALAATARYEAVAAAAGLSTAELALAWAYSRRFMAAVIVGATTLDQLRQNCAAASVVLSPETLRALDEVHAELRNPTQRD